MSVAGIATSLFGYGAQNIHSNRQKFQQEFQQLGQDLQSGNLSAAKSDMAELQQLKPASTSSSSSPIAQAFNQLSTDLQAGNLSASQQDYSTLKQDFQARAAHMHHHHGGAGSTISQLMDQLGQELQSGDLTAAQQSYSTLQQDFKLFAQNHSSNDSSSSTAGVSVTA